MNKKLVLLLFAIVMAVPGISMAEEGKMDQRAQEGAVNNEIGYHHNELLRMQAEHRARIKTLVRLCQQKKPGERQSCSKEIQDIQEEHREAVEKYRKEHKDELEEHREETEERAEKRREYRQEKIRERRKDVTEQIEKREAAKEDRRETMEEKRGRNEQWEEQVQKAKQQKAEEYREAGKNRAGDDAEEETGYKPGDFIEKWKKRRGQAE